MYTDFARVYDRLMAEVDYAGWADHYRRLMDMAGVPRGGLVAECACGTGSLTLKLCEGYEMTGIDLSQEMLSVAAEKLRLGGHRVSLVRQDMRRLKLHKPQDAVLCTCDGLNYLSGQEGAGQFFAAAHAALKPGGALVFDISSLYKLREVLGNNTLTRAEGDIRYIWRNAWPRGGQVLSLSLQLYIREPDGRFALIQEEQRQRGWEPEELKRMLEGAGFRRVRFFGGLRLDKPRDHDERIHVLCLKEK